MDSLTQIVLGASMGEVALGKKIGNKALLYGAIAGTIPDLDVLASHFTDTVSALSIHRGFTHSIVFSVVFSIVFGWFVSRYESYKNVKGWIWLFFLTFITHPILDAHTTWGTQLFWPLDIRLAFKNIFVVDPLYTLPFLICLILVLRQKRTSEKRKKYNRLGIILSSSYLLLSLIFKGIAYIKFESALKEQGVKYAELDTRPAPLNTMLWSANVDTKDSYLLANYSFFDSQPIQFYSYTKHHELLGDLVHNKKVKQMITICEGWYIITKKDGQLYFNDLRFGLLSLKPNAQNFVFQFLIDVDGNGNVNFIETPKARGDAKKILPELWDRIVGN